MRKKSYTKKNIDEPWIKESAQMSASRAVYKNCVSRFIKHLKLTVTERNKADVIRIILVYIYIYIYIYI